MLPSSESLPLLSSAPEAGAGAILAQPLLKKRDADGDGLLQGPIGPKGLLRSGTTPPPPPPRVWSWLEMLRYMSRSSLRSAFDFLRSRENGISMHALSERDSRMELRTFVLSLQDLDRGDEVGILFAVLAQEALEEVVIGLDGGVGFAG